jgi:hypothetical protein
MHGTRTRASGGASAALGSRRITVQDEEQQCLGKHKGYRGTYLVPRDARSGTVVPTVSDSESCMLL